MTLSARITGQLTSALRTSDEGERYVTIHSETAKRSVRAVIRNDQQAKLVEGLPKLTHVSVGGRLNARGAIGASGAPLALMTIYVNELQVHQQPEVTHE
ncbi:hypothetical protein [Pseudomonas oryzihabitans]|uniref:hypothetical protein n=1 Tax=Pseudomonas oryzihabitans TaxID=47885 RepID=UPI00289F212B|nr:hypothetical protein [Pseudomonas oryzihabitans]